MLTIPEMIFALVMVVIIAIAIFLLISIIFGHHEKEEFIRQIKKRSKTFKIEKSYPIKGYQYE